MGFEAKILKDSVSPEGVRLTTFEITIPRIVLAEFNTHRMFSRNSASSRAIPIKKMLQKVTDDPYIPSSWGKNQKGMQAEVEVSEEDKRRARDHWLIARDEAVFAAQRLLDIGIHKQITNRLLEPFMWHTIIITATEFSNFFNLRNNPAAHPDIRIPATMMQKLYKDNEPIKLNYGEWHTPLVTDDEAFDLNVGDDFFVIEGAPSVVKVSAARCARVSYLTHDGRKDFNADIELHDKLLTSGHLSPFEHVARPAVFLDVCNQPNIDECIPPSEVFYGNFKGWVQYRKMIKNEEDILGVK